jgi:hypothetical protein
MPSSEHARLVAVFESTALEIAAWQESGLMPGHARAGQGLSPMRSHAISESVASCYFDGTFTWRGPMPAPQPGTPSAAPDTFERLLLIIDSTGNGIGSLGGSKAMLPLVRPAA